MKKILYEISGFFTILFFIIKDKNATDFPFDPKQMTKPASTAPGFSNKQNDAAAENAPGN